MYTNVFSNFNLIDTLNAGKARRLETLGSKKFDSMLKCIDLFVNGEGYRSSEIPAKFARYYYDLLVQDGWITTDRDFFYMLSDVVDTHHHLTACRPGLAGIIHSYSHLPLDVEDNGTPAKRYMEALLADREKPDAHLYEYAAANAVFAYLVRKLLSRDPAETWITHHWRFEKNSNIATLNRSLYFQSFSDYHYLSHLNSQGSTKFRDAADVVILKYVGSVIACTYSRMFIPAILDNYGSPNFRREFAKYVEGDCHENN